jgi:competence protein ComEA
VPASVVAGGLAAGALAVGLLVLALLLPAPEQPAQPAAGFGEVLDIGPAAAAQGTGAESREEILVDVAGAVVRPGLHRLRAGDRVGDAIEAAGGFAPRADLDAAAQALNLALLLEDGTKVLVPELRADRGPAPAAADGRVDINRADQAELESLPGIGPVTAGRIIDARRERRFGSVRELRTRGLVGESVFADIKDRLTVT